MSWEGNKEYTESKLNVQPEPPKPYSFVRKVWKYVLVGVICFFLGFSVPQSRANKVAQRNRDLNIKLEKLQNQPAETVLVKVPVPMPVTESISSAKEADPVAAINETETTETTYEHNEYYDLVETSTLPSMSKYTTVIHKVLAKKDGYVSANLIAYDADGNVIDKSSDGIILTEGQYNYFSYVFSNDISDASFQSNFQGRKESFTAEQRNGVEIQQSNQNGDKLYITFKQNVDDIGYARFKFLFYKDDKINDTEDGVFKIDTDNLNSKGATDVAEIRVRDSDYDRFEYIYEPPTF